MRTNGVMAAAMVALLAGAAAAQQAFSDLKLQAGEGAVAEAQEVLPPEAVSIPTEKPLPVVGPELAKKLQAQFHELRDGGFSGVTWGRLPLGVRYVSVPLQLTTCRGCVSYTALIPAGVLAPRAPAVDPDKASYFILERTGDGLPEDRYSAPIKVAKADTFGLCPDIDAVYFRGWTLPEAVAHVQACLDKTYSRRLVTATASRFGLRVCPPDAPFACQAVRMVDGIEVRVSGRVPADDTVLENLSYALGKRRGLLLGFNAVLVRKGE